MIYEVERRHQKLLSDHLEHNVTLAAYGLRAKPPWRCFTLECLDCDAVIAEWQVKDGKRTNQKK